MGLRFRKSVRVGKYFRINISKSGIGYSFGVPGARITHSATGRKYSTVGIPGTGVSYTSTFGSKKGKKRNSINTTQQVQNVQQTAQGTEASVSTENVELSTMNSASVSDFLKVIKTAKNINIFGLVVLIAGLCFATFFTVNEILIGVLGTVMAAIGAFLMLVAHRELPACLDYEMDEESREKFNARTQAWRVFLSSYGKWQIITTANVTNRKINAGAASLVNRVNIQPTKTPFYIKTDADVVSMKLNRETIIILPDKLLIIQGSKFGAVEISDLKISVYKRGFIEDGIVPGDAEVTGHTWQYVNKDGSPDRRYVNNRQLPVCLYGYVNLSTAAGFNIQLSCSNNKNVDLLKGAFQ